MSRTEKRQRGASLSQRLRRGVGVAVIALAAGPNQGLGQQTAPAIAQHSAGKKTVARETVTPDTLGSSEPSNGNASGASNFRAESARGDESTTDRYGQWLALFAALTACALAGWAMKWARDTQRDLDAYRQAQSQSHVNDPRRDSHVTFPPVPRQSANQDHDLADLRTRVEDVEGFVEQLWQKVFPSPPVSGIEQSTTTYRQPPASIAESTPPALEILPGVLSKDEQVKVTSSSKPMVEIRWASGTPTAEVWISREYKFADLTADLLAIAFDLDGGGPGTYETVMPALVDWAGTAGTGRVRTRGRARLAGS